MVQNENMIDLVNHLIEKAIKNGCSDIHIEPFSDFIRVRNRLYGDLQVTDILPIEKHSAIITRIKIMAKLDIAEKRIPQDGRITYPYRSKEIDLRISTIPTVHGEKAEIRILDPKNFDLGLEDLGIFDEDIQKIRSYTAIENGMILFVGPTGSGKTTSLYTLLKRDNTEKVNIITIEDPVEYKIPGINQIQVNEAAKVRFDNTLRSVLRQDPDIIQIGEIRDKETAKIAMQAAITGHKVYSTLHTDDAYSAIIRLLDMGIDDYLIKAAVRFIVSQRLVKRLCPHCRKKRPASEWEKELFRRFQISSDTVYEAQTCEHCHNGYTGRMAVVEILPIDRDFIREIHPNTDLYRLKELGKKKNISTILEKALQLVLQGQISVQEFMRLNNTINHEQP